MSWLKFNINENVKVKLTPFGILLYKHKFDCEPNLDENGYYKAQLWNIMSIFGEYMMLGRFGDELPFATDIFVGCIEE